MYHVEPILGQDLDLRVFRVFVKKGNSVKLVSCPRLGLIINATFISINDLEVLFTKNQHLIGVHYCMIRPIHAPISGNNTQHSCYKNTFVS